MFICKLFHLFPRANPHKLSIISLPMSQQVFHLTFYVLQHFSMSASFIYEKKSGDIIFVHENIILLWLCPNSFYSSHKIKVMLTVASSNIFVMFSWETRHWSCPPLSLGPDLISDYNTSVHGHTADTRAANGGPRSFHNHRESLRVC